MQTDQPTERRQTDKRERERERERERVWRARERGQGGVEKKKKWIDKNSPGEYSK